MFVVKKNETKGVYPISYKSIHLKYQITWLPISTFTDVHISKSHFTPNKTSNYFSQKKGKKLLITKD